MKIVLRAAIAAASIVNIGSAYAGEGGGSIAKTLFTSLPGMVAQAPSQNVPAAPAAQNGQAVYVYATQSSHGTWLFPPRDGGGANN